jgi:hypothetical protein
VILFGCVDVMWDRRVRALCKKKHGVSNGTAFCFQLIIFYFLFCIFFIVAARSPEWGLWWEVFAGRVLRGGLTPCVSNGRIVRLSESRSAKHIRFVRKSEIGMPRSASSHATGLDTFFQCE